MDKIRCSVPILTLNAAAYLEQCLKSVADFADVFLLDGNSTDATRRIAADYNIPVYPQADTNEPNVKISDFSAMRLKAEGLARFDWILILDADEFISPGLAADIRAALAAEDIQRVFIMPKVAVMGKKLVRYVYNTPDYAPRLYHRRSGVAWKAGKLVHEKLFILANVQTVKLPSEFYSHFTSSYGEALKKDNYYLSLTRQKMFDPARPRLTRKKILWALWLNFLRAGNVLYKSLMVYLRHGFRHSLPPRHVWRYVRYHLIICWYRVEQLFF